MKKILAIVLATVLLLGLTACGSINKTEVSVLWSGNGKVEIPDSLINAMERAMYIENISYKHYGANGDQAAQTAKAEEVLNAGCSGLVVELVDPAAAQTIVDLAKAKDVPVVFINSDVSKDVVESYAKCVSVVSDKNTIAEVQAKTIFDTIKDEKAYNTADLNEDGTITYLALGDVSKTVEKVNESLKKEKLPSIKTVNASSVDELQVKTVEKKKTEYGQLTTKDGEVVEMIISDNDVNMLTQLVALQKLDMNTNKLKTHFVPVHTTGADADYKAYVFGEIKITDSVSGKNADEKLPEDILEKLDTYKNLTNMSAAETWGDLDTIVYNTRNVISDGHLSSATIVDLDSCAVAAAKAMAQLLKGKTPEETIIAISYIKI